METETISKNGRNPKSQTSRGNFLMFACVAFLSSFFMLSGCKKDNKNDGTDGPIYLLSEIESSKKWTDKFEYDNKNRITKMTVYYDGDVRDVFTLIYNNAGDLTSIHYPENNKTIMFSKNGNIITVTRSWWNEENGIRSEKIELNGQGLPSKITNETYENESSWYKGSTTFKYQGKNITEVAYEFDEVDHGETNTGGGKSTATYDDKKAPLYYCNTPEWFLIYWFSAECGIQNNVITVNDNDGNHIDTFDYTYNDAGFPLTEIMTHMQTWKDEDGNEQTDTWTYSETYKYVNSAGEEYTVAQNKASNLSNVGAMSQKREMNRSNGQAFGNMFGSRPSRK